MILVDRREKPGKRDPFDLLQCLRRLSGVSLPVEPTELPFGDVAFEGHGLNGPIAVGVERKRLHDLNACVEDARLAGHQSIGMRQM